MAYKFIQRDVVDERLHTVATALHSSNLTKVDIYRDVVRLPVNHQLRLRRRQICVRWHVGQCLLSSSSLNTPENSSLTLACVGRD